MCTCVQHVVLLANKGLPLKRHLNRSAVFAGITHVTLIVCRHTDRRTNHDKNLAVQCSFSCDQADVVVTEVTLNAQLPLNLTRLDVIGP